MKNKTLIISFLLLNLIFLNLNILFASENNRIISLIPSSTEILFAIGFGEEIVAVSNYCNNPKEEIDKLPRIGDQNLNIEKIVSLKPTILVDTNGIHARYESIFKKLNLNYVNLNIKSINDIPTESAKLSELLGNINKADNFINKWNDEINKIKSNNENRKERIKIYMEIWNNPIQAVGGTNIINSIINAAGGINVLEKQKDYPIVNSELIMIANPDIIFLAYPNPDLEIIKNRPGWKNIKAVKNNRIFAINQDIIVRPGPRNIEAVKTINEYINKVK